MKRQQFYELTKQNSELDSRLQTKSKQCKLLKDKQDECRAVIKKKDEVITMLLSNKRLEEERIQEKQEEYESVIQKKDEVITMLLSNKRSYQEQENPEAQSSKIKKMKSDFARAESLITQQLKDKEKEYNDLVLMMDDKFNALVDEKHKLSNMLELKGEQISQLEVKSEERLKEMEQESKQEVETLNNHLLDLKQKLNHRQKDYESMSKLQKELKRELECSICMDIYENPYMIPECCHRFCKVCIEEALATTGKHCPLCRCNVTSKRVLRKDELIGKISEVLICNDTSQDES